MENGLVEDLNVICFSKLCSPDKFVTKCVTKLHISVCLKQNYMLQILESTFLMLA